jgi:hypothetical protein
MQNIEQTNSEIRELTGAELETIDGAGIFGKIVHFLHDVFSGPGDHRRALDRPN